MCVQIFFSPFRLPNHSRKSACCSLILEFIYHKNLLFWQRNMKYGRVWHTNVIFEKGNTWLAGQTPWIRISKKKRKNIEYLHLALSTAKKARFVSTFVNWILLIEFTEFVAIKMCNKCVLSARSHTPATTFFCWAVFCSYISCDSLFFVISCRDGSL